MFDKAFRLVSNPQNVWKMPTSTSQQVFMVPSTSSENPHKVTVFETGKVSCDKACVNWSSHTLAVAETSKRLKEFLCWFRKRKRSPNLTSLANQNMPGNKGRKCGTRKRKGSSNKKPTEGMPCSCVQSCRPVATAVGDPSNGADKYHAPAHSTSPGKLPTTHKTGKLSHWSNTSKCPMPTWFYSKLSTFFFTNKRPVPN